MSVARPPYYATLGLCGILLVAIAVNAQQPAPQPGASATRPATAAAREVYRSAFENNVWSTQTVTRSPNGKRTFLGPFSNESTTLSLNNLPEHARVRLRFNLMIMLTWDGDANLDQPNGDAPDLFDVTVDRGPRLVHASFACRPASDPLTQSFPGRFPYDHVPSGMGATESRALGYQWPGSGGPDDYVYHIERSFAHQGRSLKIAFSGIHLQGVDDEAWGLDNVRVEILPAGAAAKFDDGAFARLWADLASADSKAFVPAIDGLIDLGDTAVASIRKRLEPPAPAVDRDQVIAQWIAMLDDESYTQREKASTALRELGAAAEPALRAARDKAPSPEVKTRIDALLERFRIQAETDEQRRMRRLVEVLELIGTQPAHAGLADIAQRAGTLAAWEATAAIQRLEGKAEIPTTLDLPPGLPRYAPLSAPAAPPEREVPGRHRPVEDSW